MYSTKDYGSMIADKVRMHAYSGALGAAVKPGDVVLDLGAGTGIFALLACQYGAARVYAIEPNENIQVAKQLARENGFSDRITFIQDVSTRVSLPEKVDVIISDLRGLLPLHGNHIPALVDARTRLLKPEGILIPRRDTLNVCIVEAPDLYKEYADPWDANPYQLRLDRARYRVINTWSTGRAKGEQVLTQAGTWGVLDYHHLESPDLQGNVKQRFVRDGVAHGLILWFDAELVEGLGFSNAPACHEHAEVYGSAFFPFLHPVDVSENDQAHLDLRAVLVNDAYIWSWNTQVTSGQGQTKASFEQSTFHGTIFSPEILRKRQPGYRPQLNSDGLIEHFIQQHMNGENSLEVIAHKLLERFPGQFSSLQEAIERAGDSSQKYGN